MVRVMCQSHSLLLDWVWSMALNPVVVAVCNWMNLYTGLSGLPCHLGSWWHPGLAAAEEHVWVHSPAVARVCVDIHGLCCHQKPQGCLCFGPPPVYMLVSEGQTSTGVITIWVVCTATWGHGDILAQAAAKEHLWVCGLIVVYKVWVNAPGSWYHQGSCRYLGSGQYPEIMLVSKSHAPTRTMLISVLCTVIAALVTSGPEQLRSVLISVAHVTTGGHRNHVCLRVMLSWPWESWSCPSLTTIAGELVPPSWKNWPHTWKKLLHPHQGSRRAGPDGMTIVELSLPFA